MLTHTLNHFKPCGKKVLAKVKEKMEKANLKKKLT